MAGRPRSSSPPTCTARASASASSSTPGPPTASTSWCSAATSPARRSRRSCAAAMDRYRFTFLGSELRRRRRRRARGARAADRRPRLLPVPGGARRARRAGWRTARSTRCSLDLMRDAAVGVARARRRAPAAAGRCPSSDARQRRPARARAAARRRALGHPRRGPGACTLDDGHEMISLGLLEHHAVAQPPRADRGAARGAHRRARSPGSEVRAGPSLNVHVPPYGSGLDEAPVLDAGLRVQTAAGQVKIGAVGSTAVRDAIERHQPLVEPARPHPRVGRIPPDRADDRDQPRAATTARGR